MSKNICRRKSAKARRNNEFETYLAERKAKNATQPPSADRLLWSIQHRARAALDRGQAAMALHSWPEVHDAA